MLKKIFAMWLKNKRLMPVLFLVLFITTKTIAQENNTGIKLFFEKLYLHTDRNFYAGGDNIWFKAYLVNAQNNYLFNSSYTMYAELIDPANTIVARQVIRIDSGYGLGDFKLDDSIAGGSYRIRAYTNWMRNFGPHFIFEKQVVIKNIPGVNKKNASAEKNIPAVLPASATTGYSIQFFPEGGSLIEGIAAAVAFKATDANGKGIDAAGSIVSAAGDTVAHFKTTHAGMGSFSFTPAAGMQYKAWVQYPHNMVATAEFAVALKAGYAMQVTNSNADAVLVKIFANAAATLLNPSGEINITAKHAGRLLYKEKLLLKDNQAALNLLTKDFPAGICSITLYDDSLRPHCERLIYVPDKDPLQVNITTDKNNYASKEKVTVHISVTDAAKNPVKTNLSLAAVDDNIEKATDGNISTYLLLQSEVKGKIENAAAYFDEKNPQRLQQLDLLLRTQGWRDYVWRRMADTVISIKYMLEQGISISGSVKKNGKKPFPDMNITLQVPNAKGNKWFTTRSNAQGNYYLDGIPLYGVQTIKISSKNDKAEKGGELFMDRLPGNPPPVAAAVLYAYDTAAFMRFAKQAAKRYDTDKNNDWFKVLEGVTVSAPKKRKSEIFRDGPYMTFGYPEESFTITAADHSFDNLGNFLLKKVNGANYDPETDGIFFTAMGKIQRPRFVVDDREDMFERIDYYNLPMNQVVSVLVRHMVGPPNFIQTMNAGGDVRDMGLGATDIFVINLVLKPGAESQDAAKIVTEVSGYYQAKLFYAPNYSIDKDVPDQRSTIHWEPIITTGENGKATISFYNADPKTTIRIDVQGVSNKGAVVVGEKKYVVE